MVQPRIGFLALYPQLATLTREIAADLKGKVEVLVQEIDPLDGELVKAKALALANKYKCDAIVARGGTVIQLRPFLQVPLVECKVHAIDILEALYVARDFNREVAMVIPNVQHYDTAKWEDMLGIKVHYFELFAWSEINEVIRQVKETGFKVVVGGIFQKKMADALGLQGVLIESGPEAVRDALGKAAEIVIASYTEKEKAARLQVLLDNVREGVVLLDGVGKIVGCNALAKRILDVHENMDYRNLPAEVQVAFKKYGVEDILQAGRALLDKIVTVKGLQLVANLVPTMVGQDVKGWVITFSEVSQVQKLEQKLRVELAEKGLKPKYELSNVIGQSKITTEIKQRCLLFAATDTTVLITGETGVGKELFAHSIHAHSRRARGPFVPINCSAMPGELLESELFGYEEGAFTGARQKGKPGFFELAHGGTLFLDEIASMPLSLQVKLLRVLQEKEVMRLGGNRLIRVDVRIVAASNCDLSSLVKKGMFREDLYYRLNVLALNIPPLRERREDVLPLFKHFVTQYARRAGYEIKLPGEDGLQSLGDYSWPGNVREVENIAQRFVVLARQAEDRDMLLRSLVQECMQKQQPVGLNIDLAGNPDMSMGENTVAWKKVVKNVEKQMLEQLLSQGKINKAELAKILNMSRTTLWSKLKDK